MIEEKTQGEEVLLPKLGESIFEAQIVKWLKNEGEEVKRDEPVVEVLTDKVASEIPSPTDGVILKCLKLENEICMVGEPLFVVQKQKGQGNLDASFYSPAVLRLAADQGISVEELKKIRGSGEGGRVSKKDLLQYAESKQEKVSPVKISSEGPLFSQIKLSPLRVETARAMQASHREIPAAYFITEVDVSNVLECIKEEKHHYYQEHGAKLTVSSFVIRAIAKAACAYPHVNATLAGDLLKIYDDVNLGIAVSVNDTVAVPVIEKAQELQLVQIAKKLTLLVDKAKHQKLSYEDVASSTLTMTNFGMAKMQIGIPMIRPNQVAIVGVGAIEKKVTVAANNEVQIRSIMNLSLAFDHRVIDGMYAAGFLNLIKEDLEAILKT